ncbi:MAG: class I SAM-dependent rRNA methyltransferase [Rikenellaceae bacterium]|nr:class I SAM-dependent rRNA methyltransferase [Rikenellaceae bacterium]
MYPKLYLKRNKEESLLRRHPWVFSGALARADGQLEEGTIADVCDSGGKFLARGHCQIGSIAVRVLTFRDEPIDRAWWIKRTAGAYAVRKALGLAGSRETTCYRLIHGEGDMLPGLIVDIYGDTAVMQCHSVGMFVHREDICAALREVLGGELRAVYDKSSRTAPFNAGLDAADGYLWKAEDYPDQEEKIVLESGRKFAVDWERGQKTGLFLDQRESRRLVMQFARGRRVLNTFCYTGGFSIFALGGGAASVDSVDSSGYAVEMADRNVLLNFGAGTPHRAFTADATKFVRDTDGRYDMIILDPPAFAKHLKAVPNALQAYRRLNASAIAKIEPGGILFTFSCSQAVLADQFRTMVFSAAAIAGRSVRVLHRLSQPADHPVNIYHPEGEYLKGLVLYVE